VDENGITQEPKFGVSSFRGKAIREWSSKLYEQVVKARTNDVSQRVEARTSNNESPQTSDDPVKVLKIRFAKGEISKEEYVEMRKMIE
jgi:hypothetical protein